MIIMNKYDKNSLKAEEFINDGEILDSLKFADENKNNLELVDKIIEKARLKKGINHREASVLLACEDKERIKEIYNLARQIKKDFYGDRIVMFAPLYLSNYCVNGCVYCPYHAKNKHICRKKLTQDEVRKEVIALQDMGHKRLAIEAGEDPVNNPIEYILDCIKTIYSVNHKNGAIRRVNVNIAATTVENYKKLKEAGIDRPTHVFVQAGVGSLAGAVVGYFAHKYKENPPVMVVCEASAADCLYRSAMKESGDLVNVGGDLQTIMAGLACGEANTIGWDILRNHVSVFASCPDWMSAKATRIYANPLGNDPHIVSGESGSVPLGLCFTALHDEDAKDLKEALKLDENSVVLVISTEGDTDPVRYREIVWDGLYGTNESLSK